MDNLNKLYEELKDIFERYNSMRTIASELLDCEGMEEAVIDELESRGYEITESV